MISSYHDDSLLYSFQWSAFCRFRCICVCMNSNAIRILLCHDHMRYDRCISPSCIVFKYLHVVKWQQQYCVLSARSTRWRQFCFPVVAGMPEHSFSPRAVRSPGNTFSYDLFLYVCCLYDISLPCLQPLQVSFRLAIMRLC